MRFRRSISAMACSTTTRLRRNTSSSTRSSTRDSRIAGLQVLQDAGIRDLVEHHPVGSEVVLPRLAAEGTQFDLAFVDGNHRFDAVFVDLFYLGHLVRKGGIIILDDYNLPGIKRAASFFVTNIGWRIEEASPPDDKHCWVVLRTSENEDT